MRTNVRLTLRHLALPLLFLPSLLISACSSSQAPAPPSEVEEKRAITNANARWDAASVKRDPVALAELMADDFIDVGTTGTVGEKTEFLKSLSSSQGYGYDEHRSTEVSTKLYGTAAVMNGLLVRTGDAKRPQDTGNFRFTRVWVKVNGDWKVTANQFAQIPGAAPKASAAPTSRGAKPR